MDTKQHIEALEAAVQPITPQDTIAEAGRKATLKEFVRMLKHEAGSRSGEDIEDAHQMRVAIRRIRSTFRLLEAYYKPKRITPYRRALRKVARALGAIRDLDVLLANLSQFQEAANERQRAELQAVIVALEQERAAARDALNAVLDRKAYRRFVRNFSDFLTTPGAGARALDSDDVAPIQTRHVLPGLIQERLAAVLAYDTVLGEADVRLLHSLRIEFKRLRYAVSSFEEVLGAQAHDFLEGLKAIQDNLGRLHDISIGQEYLDALPAGHEFEAARAYLERLNAEESDLITNFQALWSRFNSRKAQTKLSTALLSLR